jgi:hypothetical protein
MYRIYLTDGNGIVFLSLDIHNKKEHNLQQDKYRLIFLIRLAKLVSQEEGVEAKGIKMLL